MRSTTYSLLTTVLLGTELFSCISDHRIVSPLAGQNYQLAGYTITSSDYDPAQQIGSAVFQRNSTGRLLTVVSTISYPNNPQSQLTQTFSYNPDNLLTESSITLDLPNSSILVGSGYHRVYQYENQKIKTVKKYSIIPTNPTPESLVYQDQITYDAQGRLAEVDRSYYDESSSASGVIATSKLTYVYDGRNNPIVVNQVLKTAPGFGNSTTRRKYTFEYDDQPNALTQIDLVTPSYWILNNPFDTNDFYLGLATNNPTKQTLTSTSSSENSVYNFTYEYKNGLVNKASFPLRYFNSISDAILTYQFNYTPL